MAIQQEFMASTKARMLNHEDSQKIFNEHDAIIRPSWQPSMNTSTASTSTFMERVYPVECMNYTFDELNMKLLAISRGPEEGPEKVSDKSRRRQRLLPPRGYRAPAETAYSRR